MSDPQMPQDEPPVPKTSDDADPMKDASAAEEDQRPPEEQGLEEWPSGAAEETPDSAEPGDAAES
jgi:hypothetical protein